ncbi:glycosyltransferase family 4 protein [Calothrix rhizosoleniae]|uniref:glycosyltransferase family 4 protein n=1 Tax=Calothrix rhizosoleniae TaxID=888997 RepID=UPI000B49E67C|nr:glycosyltransferase family 4 protein [Calothrix rhizosoleniae]
MTSKKLKVLLIVEQCAPEGFSVPLEGYNYYKAIDEIADVTLVTHGRNEKAIQKIVAHKDVTYIHESNFSGKYHSLVEKLTHRGRVNWPLHNVLSYPIYAEFNHKVYQKFNTKVLRGDYDLVHALTPMMPRYPVKIAKACKNTPFILGPVNGGVPFPSGFQEVARQESAQFNFLRAIGRYLIPGYVQTYKKADKILAGSTYTLNLLKKLFKITDSRIQLFYENGITSNFLHQTKTINTSDQVNLLFVGRLVPYKGADMVIEAIGKLEQSIRKRIVLTIVGDGSEKSNLETRVQELNLGETVKFAGWVAQQKTLNYYSKSDIFCFPSIREFGGAVVLEAMACGLPCIVVNNGGIGEYVTEETGFKIEPISREYIIGKLSDKIKVLVNDEQLRRNMSQKSINRAAEFTWEQKAKNILDIYSSIISQQISSTVGSDMVNEVSISKAVSLVQGETS